jgi:eukaryotic translation initiation factor 2C
MGDAGMQVSTEPVKINGRVLPTPKLVFGDNAVSDFGLLTTCTPLIPETQPTAIQNGGWNITKSQFIEPKPLVAWAVVDYSHSPDRAQRFINMLSSCFDVLGECMHRFVPSFI